MGRWALLAHAAGSKTGWSPEQTGLAFDLLGTPLEFRDGNKPAALIDSRGRAIESAHDPAAFARRMIDELESRRDLLSGLDEAKQCWPGPTSTTSPTPS